MISSQPINVVAKQMPARDASEIRKQRKRKPVEMDSMPEDDAAERKRVLNVLAQRRYIQQGQRKKQEQAVLDELVQSTQQTQTTSSLPSLDTETNISTQLYTPPESNSTPSSSIGLWSTETEDSTDGQQDTDLIDFSNVDLLQVSNPKQPFDADSWSATCNFFGPWVDTSTTTSDFDFPSQDMVAFGSGTEFGPSVQRQDPSLTISLDPDMLLNMPEVDLFRAFDTLADMIKSSSMLFNIAANSIFNAPNARALPWVKNLPQMLQPVEVQFTIPHHPFLDLLPWPSVRRKVIIMFSMPEKNWPKDCNGTSLGFMEFVHDCDIGGVAIKGSDPVQEEAWDVDDEFAQKWWWALDPKVLRTADKWRRESGRQPLKMTAFAGKY